MTPNQTTFDTEGEYASAESNSDQSQQPAVEQPDSGAVVEWACPYCSHTRQSVKELRQHITSSADDAHMGENGWSVQDDLVGYNESGDVARVIEGFEPVNENPEEEQRGFKKKQIVNAWLARPFDADVDAINAVSKASRQYVYTLLRQLNEDELTDEEVAELHDPDLEEELGEEIDEFLATQTESPADQTTEKKPTMSTEQTIETPDELKDHPKKELIHNAYMLAPDVAHNDVAEVIGSSREYVRRTFKQIEDGDVDTADVEANYDEGVQRMLWQSLEAMGALEGVEADTSDTAEIPIRAEPLPEDEQEWGSFDERSKNIVINSWSLAQDLGQDLHNTTVAKAAGCSDEYARRTLKEIEDGDIPEYEVEEAEAQDLKNALFEEYARNGYLVRPEDMDAVDESESSETEAAEPAELSEAAEEELQAAISQGRDVVEDFEIGEDGFAVQCAATTGDGSRCGFSAQDESNFCHLPAHTVDVSEEAEEAEEPSVEVDGEAVGTIEDDVEMSLDSGSKRDGILNLIGMVGTDGIRYQDAAALVGSSDEYARRTFREYESNDITEGDVQAATDESIRDELRENAVSAGMQLPGGEVSETEETELETEEPTVEWEEEPEPAAEAESSAEAEAVAEVPGNGGVPASEVKRVMEVAELLREQAEFEGDEAQHRKAEFVAKKIQEELGQLLETHVE